MPSDGRRHRPLTIAIAALGGQGGGVLTEWLVSTAEAYGWQVQSTSVPGVAQRTGATIYYIEAAPPSADGRPAVMALMPVPGDVDLAIGAELMEAGRAVQRGLVTPDRTTLIASLHRVYGITEKSALGDGIADGEAVLEAMRAQSRRLVCFDMQEAADESRCVISAVLLGAAAAHGGLPFPRSLYEQVIRESGVMVDANLRGFAAGFEQQLAGGSAGAPAAAPPQPSTAAGRALEERVRRTMPAPAYGLVLEAVRRLMDYQDAAYAAEYLDRLDRLLADGLAEAELRSRHELLAGLARHLALAMTYEDTIRVAQLKCRESRFRRVREEVRAAPDQLVYTTEFLHPRMEEIAETLPAWLGAWLLGSGLARRLVSPLVRRGKHIRTGTVAGFALLYLLAALRPWRRATLRFRHEQAWIDDWLRRVQAAAATGRTELAMEIVACQRLIKGYSDTHQRGTRNFHMLMGIMDEQASRPDLPQLVRTLRSAALADEEGAQLAARLAEFGLAAAAPGKGEPRLLQVSSAG